MFRSTYDLSQMNQSWMEHQALEHVKQALRVTIEWQAPTISYQRKRQSVMFALESFARHLERLMAIEEEDGYMRIVREVKPNKEESVVELRAEHATFRQRMAKLSGELDTLDEWQEAEFERICKDIGKLLDAVGQHDRREVNLLQEAMLLDEGVGD